MIFDRRGGSAESWCSRLEKPTQGRLLGRYFAGKRERLREVGRYGRRSVSETSRRNLGSSARARRAESEPRRATSPRAQQGSG